MNKIIGLIISIILIFLICLCISQKLMINAQNEIIKEKESLIELVPSWFVGAYIKCTSNETPIEWRKLCLVEEIYINYKGVKNE